MELIKQIIITIICSAVVSWIVSDIRCNRHLKSTDEFVKKTLDHVKQMVKDVVTFIEKKYRD